MQTDSTILFITSNGTGLGHLTRSMAIGRRLGDGLQSRVLTLSGAAPVVKQIGFPVEYVASLATPGSGNGTTWNRRLARRVQAVIAETRPTVVVFDGVHPYWGLINALAVANGSTTVWNRRPLWQPKSNRGSLEREAGFDFVLEPGELAESFDRGPTVARREFAHRVAPIVFLDREELVPRAEAEAELGLDPNRRHVLIQLGQGAQVRGALKRCLAHLSGRDDYQVVALESALHSLSDVEVPDDVVHLHSSYPMSRLYAAFDAVVSASGYNAYHELIGLGVPSLFFGMPRQTDDQAARALYAEEAGIGLGLETADDDELEQKLDRLLDETERARMLENISKLPALDGATAAAEWITELSRRRSSGDRPERELLRGGFIWRRGRFLPPPKAVAEYVFGFVRNTIPWRRGRPIVVFALGVDDKRLEDGLAEILAAGTYAPSRYLVITDSLNFRALRDAEVGFEHIPAHDHPERLIEGDESFILRRTTLILDQRPRPLQALTIGEADPALLELATMRIRVVK